MQRPFRQFLEYEKMCKATDMLKVHGDLSDIKKLIEKYFSELIHCVRAQKTTKLIYKKIVK